MGALLGERRAIIISETENKSKPGEKNLPRHPLFVNNLRHRLYASKHEIDPMIAASYLLQPCNSSFLLYKMQWIGYSCIESIEIYCSVAELITSWDNCVDFRHDHQYGCR